MQLERAKRTQHTSIFHQNNQLGKQISCSAINPTEKHYYHQKLIKHQIFTASPI